jgi:hypothetical protein
VSPKSRGRTPRNPSRREHRRSAAAPRSPGVQLLQELDRELQDADTLSAELAVSALLGAARLARHGDPATDRAPADLVAELVRQAAKVRRPTSLGLLQCLAALGGPGERDLVDAGIRRLTAAGVQEPAWATTDDVAPTGAWTVRDVYGDAETIAIEFARPCRPHALVVLVDHTQGGVAAGAFVDDDPDDVRTERDRQGPDPLVVIEELDLGTARARTEAAIAALDTADPADVDDDLVATRALALARLRALPAPEPAPPAPEPLDEAGRAALVEDFLASPEAAQLPAGPAVERCARLILDHRAETDPANPLRISPGTLADLLLDRLPDADLSDDEAAAVPDVVLAWARFAGGRMTLPTAALDQLISAAGELADTYRTARTHPELADGRGRQLAMSYAGDLLEDGFDPAALEDAIARRAFAMPYVGTTIGDEDYPSLDPADPDDRGLLITGEHPEYHAALEDPFADAEIDGVNPRLHLAVHEMVANQLWDDDPPEAWRAAQRLLAAGMERHDVLHELAGVATELLWHALTDHRPVDLDAYRAALDALDARPAARPRRPVRSVPKNQEVLFDPPAATPPRPTVVRRPPPAPGKGSRRTTSYQIKIRLLRTKPPVWRRVRVPGDLSLAELHDVIQVAMGWSDTHLHDFRVGDVRYGDPEQLSDDWLDDTRDEATVRIVQVLPRVGDRLRYTYDFGDNWEHEVLVESVAPALGAVPLQCLAGRRAGPPEDCGGVWGYADLCSAAQNPDDPTAAERLGWLGYRFDPASFDREAVDEQLRSLRRG